MVHILVKVEPDLDLYVIWSTNTDCPIAWGDRQQIADDLFRNDEVQYRFPEAVRDEITKRFIRADMNGTSALYPREGPKADMGWEDDTFMVMENGGRGSGILRRKNLRVFLETWDGKGFDPQYLEPFDDD